MRTLLFALLLFVTACSSAKQLTPEMRYQASKATAKWLIEEHGEYENSFTSSYLDKISARLNQGIVHPPSWSFFILDSKEVNAFAIGHATIVLTRGLLEHVETEGQLAAVIAHEMSHELKGHVEQALIDQIERNESGEQPSPKFHFSVEQEKEADKTALTLLLAGGFDLNGAIEAIYLFSRLNDKKVSHENWADTRLSHIAAEIRHYHRTLPGTHNSRNFYKMKATL